jgi:CheY-like chemotaxis protein
VLHFLLAEDNLGDILLVQKALEEHHVEHEMYIVRDGAEALDFVRRMGHPGEAPCPDLMLLDLNLPKADGQQVLSEFRKHPECGHTPVIVVSSADNQKDRGLLAKYGISRYFRKPSDYDSYLKLGEIVLEVVGNTQTGRPA